MNNIIIILFVIILIIIFFWIVFYKSKEFVEGRHLFWCKLANNLGISIISSSIVGAIILKDYNYLLISIIGIILILIDIQFNPSYLSKEQINELKKFLNIHKKIK